MQLTDCLDFLSPKLYTLVNQIIKLVEINVYVAYFLEKNCELKFCERSQVLDFQLCASLNTNLALFLLHKF